LTTTGWECPLATRSDWLSAQLAPG
jgi:hypothetical protein